MPERNRCTVAMALPSALVGTSRQRDRHRAAGLRVPVPLAEVTRAEVFEDERHDGRHGGLGHIVARARDERERRRRQALGEALRLLGRNDGIVLSPEQKDRDLTVREATLRLRDVGRLLGGDGSDQDERVAVVASRELHCNRTGSAVGQDGEALNARVAQQRLRLIRPRRFRVRNDQPHRLREQRSEGCPDALGGVLAAQKEECLTAADVEEGGLVGVRFLRRHGALRIASMTRTTRDISRTSWTRTMWTPRLASHAAVAAVPSSRSSGSASRRCPIKAFLDVPNATGTARSRKAKQCFKSVRLCSEVLPKPMPGSTARCSFAMPASTAARIRSRRYPWTSRTTSS